MVIPTETANRIDGAAQLLVEEVASVDAAIAAQEKALSALRTRRARVIDALRTMQSSLSGDLADQASGIIRNEPIASSDYAIRSQKVKQLLDHVRSNPQFSWSPEQVRIKLGDEFSEKYTANTMRRLHEEGLLVRVGRGLYKASGQLVAVEGLTEQDHERLGHPGRAGT